MTSSIKNQMVVGAIWMMGMRWSIRCIGLVSTVILARLLVPEDFGIVAMSMLIIGFIDVITTLRLEVIIIREKVITDKILNTIWTLNIIRGVIVTITLVLCAPLMSMYFSEPRLIPVVYLLAFGGVVYSFVNVGITFIQKNLEFGREFKYNVITKLCTFVITLFFVFYLKNYWALIIGITSGMIIKTILSYVMHEYRPSFSLSEWRRLLSFSSIMMINEVISFFNGKISEILIGGSRTTADLGNFSMSGNIASIPKEEIITPMVKSLLPGFSKISSEYERLKCAFLNSSHGLMILILPIGVGFYAITPNIIPILLGEKWISIIPLCQVMILASCLGAININYYTVLLTIKKEKTLMWLNGANLVTIIPVIYWAVSSGGTLIDIALAELSIITIYTLVITFITFKILNIPIINFYYMTRRPIIATYIMYICVDNISDFLILKIVTGAIIYPIVLIVLCYLTDKKNSTEFELFKIGKRMINR